MTHASRLGSDPFGPRKRDDLLPNGFGQTRLQGIKPTQMRLHKNRRWMGKLLKGRRSFLGLFDEQSFVLIVDLLHVRKVIRVKLAGRYAPQSGEPLRKFSV